MKRLFLLLFCAVFLGASATPACFGPKLYLGTPEGPTGETLFALVSLYLKEKTGTEVVRVALEENDPLAELAAERVDMVFSDGRAGEGVVLLETGDWPALVSGPRPLEALQFTTVAPALEKFDGLLVPKDLAALVARVEQGEPPLAAARRFLMERAWI